MSSTTAARAEASAATQRSKWKPRDFIPERQPQRCCTNVLQHGLGRRRQALGRARVARAFLFLSADAVRGYAPAELAPLAKFANSSPISCRPAASLPATGAMPRGPTQGDHDDDFDLTQKERGSQGASEFREAGYIKEITAMNFMCHKNLKAELRCGYSV